MVCFQNCGDFSLQEEIMRELALKNAAEEMDAKLLPPLLAADTLRVWSKNEDPSYILRSIAGDQWSFVVVVDGGVSGKIISLDSGTDIEEGKVLIENGLVQVIRRQDSILQYEEKLQGILPADGTPTVIAVSFGSSAGDMLLQINGRIEKAEVQSTGVPADFSNLSKNTYIDSRVSNYIIYAGNSSSATSGAAGGKLLHEELNVMSRYVARSLGLSGVIFDPSFLDKDAPTTKESLEFKAAKAVFESRCLSCHNGLTSINLSNLTEAKALKNSWVVKGSPTESLLYYRLKGSSGSHGPKTMPLSNESLSNEELQKIESWINSININ
ncbi:hypothetical protein AZI86_01755 [Bdellovibrio bacteriovorus]|uniref:Cytochrome c domain-containing protein n=2 Tax=Bdellovibrio bacteriovorus TaxID=959 RepID=A0A150WN70_BDEBC|nr:hypothetical protein AZI86_01755 [Bdellovibrio bacteriovorus]